LRKYVSVVTNEWLKTGRDIIILTTGRCQIKYTHKKLHSANRHCL